MISLNDKENLIQNVEQQKCEDKQKELIWDLAGKSFETRILIAITIFEGEKKCEKVIKWSKKIQKKKYFGIVTIGWSC